MTTNPPESLTEHLHPTVTNIHVRDGESYQLQNPEYLEEAKVTIGWIETPDAPIGQSTFFFASFDAGAIFNIDALNVIFDRRKEILAQRKEETGLETPITTIVDTRGAAFNIIDRQMKPKIAHMKTNIPINPELQGFTQVITDTDLRLHTRGLIALINTFAMMNRIDISIKSDFEKAFDLAQEHIQRRTT